MGIYGNVWECMGIYGNEVSVAQEDEHVVHQSEGRWFLDSCLHFEVSLCKILNPKLLPMVATASCLVACHHQCVSVCVKG